jgi:hypothetical protein
MRLVGGAAFVAQALETLHSAQPAVAVLSALAIAAGLLLLAGLWTPIAGSLGAAISIWFALNLVEEPLAAILLATMGAGLALVGPGAWSADAKLFGWKRIDVRDRTK